MRLHALANVAESNRAVAESNRSVAESNRATAESNRTTAESNHIVAKEIEAAEWEEDDLSPVRNIAAAVPEPFPLDKWSFETQAEFNSLIPPFVSTLQSIASHDVGECVKLCFRFLAHALVTHETYFESLFVNPDSHHAQFLLNGLEVKTGIEVKKCVNNYIDGFVKGGHVMYRNLDAQGNLIELVNVEIVDVDGYVRGAFTIKSHGKEKSTMIDRLQPTENITKQALLG